MRLVDNSEMPFPACLARRANATGRLDKREKSVKCSFCEATLVCKHCGKPFRPRQAASHLAIYQRDMQVSCPECQQVLVCKGCNYVYGDPDEEEED